MPQLILYHSPYSPFSRSVLILCRYLKIDVNVKVLDLLSDEQMSPEFIKVNPQHCVPTIDDGGFHLWESRAILTYLIESRAPHLMPTSPKAKAVMNQRLQFEQNSLAMKYAALFVRLDLGLYVIERSHHLKPSSDRSSRAARNLSHKQSLSFMRFSASPRSTFSRSEMNGLPAQALPPQISLTLRPLKGSW